MRAALHELANSGSGSDMTAFCPSALRGPHRMLAMPPIQQDDMLTAQQPSSLCHRAGSTSCPSLQGAGSVWPAGWGCRAAADPIASVEPETGVACPIEQCQAQYRRSRGTSSSADSMPILCRDDRPCDHAMCICHAHRLRLLNGLAEAHAPSGALLIMYSYIAHLLRQASC